MELIEQLEGNILLSNMEQPECPVAHNFSDGVYIREITMPTDSLIVGHEHKTRHLNIISKGRCRLLDMDTGDITEIQAPYTFESEAGIRKVLYIEEECVWSTVHVTNTTDLDELEAELITKSYTHIKLEGGNKCLG